MDWNRASRRINELEEKQASLLEDYNGITELISEDLEEQDLDSLRMHVADITDILQDLEAIRDELEHLCNIIDNAIDDARMGDW